MSEVPERLAVTREGRGLPTTEVLTGRGFVTGKSGSGKSNTASVVAEELLDAGLPLCIVDTDGEYYGLKESYELLHVGGDDRCDRRVGPGHAARLARLALEEGVPVILDASGYPTEGEARETVAALVQALFRREKNARRPFPLVVEELHEYLPEQGGRDEAGDALVRVAKRGRKRGLGLVGLSQRPAAVSKEYVTQCDWLVFHRLTWENDTRVVGRVLGGEYADRVADLDAGEAYLRADWEDDVRRVQFRRKETFDAGATPDLEGVERPDLRSVDADLLAELDAADPDTSADGDEPADVEALRAELDAREQRIAELEAEVRRLREVAKSRGSDPDADGASADADADADGAVSDLPATPEQAAGDPVWEAGQLTRTLVGRVARRCRRALGRGPASNGADSGSSTGTGGHPPTDAED